MWASERWNQLCWPTLIALCHLWAFPGKSPKNQGHGLTYCLQMWMRFPLHAFLRPEAWQLRKLQEKIHTVQDLMKSELARTGSGYMATRVPSSVSSITKEMRSLPLLPSYEPLPQIRPVQVQPWKLTASLLSWDVQRKRDLPIHTDTSFPVSIGRTLTSVRWS